MTILLYLRFILSKWEGKLHKLEDPLFAQNSKASWFQDFFSLSDQFLFTPLGLYMNGMKLKKIRQKSHKNIATTYLIGSLLELFLQETNCTSVICQLSVSYLLKCNNKRQDQYTKCVQSQLQKHQEAIVIMFYLPLNPSGTLI